MLQRCPECGGGLVAKLPRQPIDEPEFDETLALTAEEDAARARSEGPDYAHSATELTCTECGAVVEWLEKDARYEVPPRG